MGDLDAWMGESDTASQCTEKAKLLLLTHSRCTPRVHRDIMSTFFGGGIGTSIQFASVSQVV